MKKWGLGKHGKDNLSKGSKKKRWQVKRMGKGERSNYVQQEWRGQKEKAEPNLGRGFDTGPLKKRMEFKKKGQLSGGSTDPRTAAQEDAGQTPREKGAREEKGCTKIGKRRKKVRWVFEEGPAKGGERGGIWTGGEASGNLSG